MKSLDGIIIIKKKKKANKKSPFSCFLHIKKAFVMGVVLVTVLAQTSLFNAYEAHIINVTAKICDYSETRTMGYWKNHTSVYEPLLPQYLGNDIIDTQQKVEQVFLDYNLSMRNKLKGQLLAMKFNVAYFGIGEYYVESEGKTLNEIVAEADDLLKQDPEPSQNVLENMKDILDYLNNLHQIGYCSSAAPLPDDADTDPISEGIVLNEFLPNPNGNECRLDGVAGEWAEIYNNSDIEKDLADWQIRDSGNHTIAISGSNTHTGVTTIGAKDSGSEWLVVFLNGCVLNNSGGDSVNLYNADGQLIDSYSYSGSAPENKSYARVPDGTGAWFDPIPTPGGPNILEGTDSEDIVIEETDETISYGGGGGSEFSAEQNNEQSQETISEPIAEPIFEQQDEEIEITFAVDAENNDLPAVQTEPTQSETPASDSTPEEIEPENLPQPAIEPLTLEVLPPSAETPPVETTEIPPTE